MTRIVVFGATGYTGRLVTRQLVAAGLRPVVAGRDADRLDALRAEHGGLPGAVANATDPASVRAIVEKGDVVVSTVGPFTRYGRAAVDAAVDAGAHYVDSTGESDFMRYVFDTAGPRAAEAGVALLTASGFDHVPGNLAGALALREAGADARRVDICYAVLPPGGSVRGLGVSSGTRATLLGCLLSPVEALRGGRLVTRPYLREVQVFHRDEGRPLPAALWSGNEARTLPRLAPQLTDVATYMGGFGALVRLAPVASWPLGLAGALPPLRRLAMKAATPALRVTGQGPDSASRDATRSRVLATVRDATGRELASVRLDGGDPYDLTAGFIAWIAGRLSTGAVTGSGALGPVEAFGLDALNAAAEALGLRRTG
jgi:short subunit dehydrogenase-like uncharacterized protein